MWTLSSCMSVLLHFLMVLPVSPWCLKAADRKLMLVSKLTRVELVIGEVTSTATQSHALQLHSTIQSHPYLYDHTDTYTIICIDIHIDIYVYICIHDIHMEDTYIHRYVIDMYSRVLRLQGFQLVASF